LASLQKYNFCTPELGIFALRNPEKVLKTSQLDIHDRNALYRFVMSDKKNTNDFVHIGNIIPNALKNYRRQPDSGMGKVWEVWNDAVGKMIAENARPSAFKGKLMIVNVSSSAWIQNLQFEKDEIIKKVNAGLGKRQVQDIQFKVGPLK